MQNHATAVTTMLSMLDQFQEQPEEVRSYFLHETKLFTFRKGELLLKAGDYCEYIYFVVEGVVRGYIVDGEREVTTWLTCEHELVTSISSLDVERPAVEHIEAVLDCTLLGMPVQKMDELYRLHPVFNITGRKLIQKYYRDAGNESVPSAAFKCRRKISSFFRSIPATVEPCSFKIYCFFFEYYY